MTGGAGGTSAVARAFRLSDVVSRLDAKGLLVAAPGVDPEVTGIVDDSRQVRAGDLFCAWVGTNADAHRFLPAAEAAGAAAALVEREVPDARLPLVVVRDGRRAAAEAAMVAFGDPAASLLLAGVTGTNGKTTTVWLLRHVLAGGRPSASLGTLGVIGADGAPVPGTESLTTPGPVQLARTLRELVDAGVRAVAMEVSSHALDQGRVSGLRFDAAVFTNLSRDHLDYHGTVEAYRDAKLSLAGLLRAGGVVVYNADEPAWAALPARVSRALSFSVGGTADVHAVNLEIGPQGARFDLVAAGQAAPVVLPLLGAFNVQNALGAAGAALGLGIPLEEVAARLRTVPQVPGRLERIADSPCPVLRDYAHTPDALERVLAALRPLVKGRLIVVFGAGGDRDRGKRPLMGAAVQRYADVPIVTSDNPRTEAPEAIIDDIVTGMSGDYVREVDRRRAIALALSMARADDVVLLAGKGHETYQVVGTEKRPFDEREIVRALVASGGEVTA
ncbi:MAG TPA: UDP-N-acetylmuramoyl-L-alanyl-D-glutamate--2,6-diaminopimelate ligase [Longimicrobiales bacterium]